MGVNRHHHFFTKDFLFICVFSFLIALANSIGFIATSVQKPTNTIYLGTIHYWEDYFLYLNHFFQGAHGAWLTVNRYTSETTNPSIVYWSNVLLGKVGSFFAMSPIISYNVSVIILSFLVLVSSYILLKTRFFPLKPQSALTAFLFATLSTSLINYVKSGDGSMVFWPFQIWRSPHFAFDRLGGAPHQLMQTLLFYWTLFFLFAPKIISAKKETFITIRGALLAFLLATINPIQAGFLAGIALLTAGFMFFISGKKTLPIPAVRLLAIALSAIVGSVYVNSILSEEPHIQSKLWETLQQGHTTLGFLFFSIGPVLVILSGIGTMAINRTCKTIELFGFLTIVVGYFLFLSPIPNMIGMSNMRILFPSNYIFWGALAVSGLTSLQKFLNIRVLILIFFLVSTVPSLTWELSQKMPTAKDQTDPLVYLPRDSYEAFTSLTGTGRYDDIVLANPVTHMDSLVPALSGHTTFAGHMLATVDNEEKQKQSGQFFTGLLSEDAALLFLKENAIRYIIASTKYETTSLPRWYPFLKPYKTFGDLAAIFTF